MVNKLQIKRSQKTKNKIKETLLKKYQEQGGMKESVKRKISEKMKRNWELKRQEIKNNDIKKEDKSASEE